MPGGWRMGFQVAVPRAGSPPDSEPQSESCAGTGELELSESAVVRTIRVLPLSHVGSRDYPRRSGLPDDSEIMTPPPASSAGRTWRTSYVFYDICPDPPHPPGGRRGGSEARVTSNGGRRPGSGAQNLAQLK